jgi:hypothetical protein
VFPNEQTHYKKQNKKEKNQKREKPKKLFYFNEILLKEYALYQNYANFQDDIDYLCYWLVLLKKLKETMHSYTLKIKWLRDTLFY